MIDGLNALLLYIELIFCLEIVNFLRRLRRTSCEILPGESDANTY